MSKTLYSPKVLVITRKQEAVVPSRHDLKIVDRDVKPQHKQTNKHLLVGMSNFLLGCCQDFHVAVPILFFCLVDLAFQLALCFLRVAQCMLVL